LVLGKQIIYHAIQDPTDEATSDELASLDAEIKALKAQITTARANEKRLKAELNGLGTRISTCDLRAVVSGLEAEKHALEGGLAPPPSDGIEAWSLSVDEKERMEQEWRMWQHHVTVRKRIFRDLWERCAEVPPEEMTRAELWDSLGLEGTVS
jgi:26S proteasome regulatory subunit (ATPase 3-interacting protein)